jgi:hypothetical protein
MDVSYRLLSRPLRALRFGYSRLIGTTPSTPRGNGTCPAPEEGMIRCSESAGYRAGGWVELQWQLAHSTFFDSRALIQATPTGFGLGARGELRFGEQEGSHFAMGLEGISEVGSTAYVRLAWATVPRFPMAATIELTDYPSSHRDTGVRLLYDVQRRIGAGLSLGLRLGYQARDESIGGLTSGVNASLDF